MNEPMALLSFGSWVLKKPGNSAIVAMKITTKPLTTARRCFLKRHQTSFQFGATEMASASSGRPRAAASVGSAPAPDTA